MAPLSNVQSVYVDAAIASEKEARGVRQPKQQIGA
jgi:hypothetical protein